MEHETKEQQESEVAIHRAEWFVFGLGSFVMSGLIAVMLKLKMPDAPTFPVIFTGGLLMLCGFLLSSKPRKTTDTE